MITTNNKKCMEVAASQRFIDQLPMAAFIIRPGDDYPLYANLKLSVIFGCGTEVWHSDPGFWRRSIHSDDYAAVQSALTDARTGNHACCDFRLTGADGAARRLRCHASKAPVDDGDRDLVLGIVFDPAEEDHALLGGGRELERLMLASPVVVYRREPGGEYPPTYISANVRRQLGFEAAQLLANPRFWLQSIHPEDRAGMVAGMGNLFAIGQYCHEYRFRHRDGYYVWVRDEQRLTHDKSGRVRDIVGSLIDISRSKQLEADRNTQDRKLELSRKMQAISTLAGGIAHEFNNMLGVIFGFSELIVMQTSEGDKIRDYIQHVMQAAQRSKDLVQQLLSMARKKQQYQKQVDLKEQIAAEVEFLRGALPTTVHLNLETDAACARTLLDPGELRLILTGLADNAAHAMNNNGQLLISLRPALTEEIAAEHLSGDYTCLEVADTGIGMST